MERKGGTGFGVAAEASCLACSVVAPIAVASAEGVGQETTAASRTELD